MRSPAAVLALLSLLGCSPGEITGGPGGQAPGVDAGNAAPADADPASPDATPPDFQLSVTPAAVDTILGTVTEIQVTLQSENFQGSAALSVSGAPASWQVSFTPAVVTVPRDGSATSTMTITIPTNAEASETPTSLSISGSGSPGQRTQIATVAVANEVVVTLPAGTGENDHSFPAPLEINLGTQVTIANADSQNHRIHSGNGDEGFIHQPNEMGQGQGYTFTLNTQGSFNYYCHIHDVGAGVGRIVVAAP